MTQQQPTASSPTSKKMKPVVSVKAGSGEQASDEESCAVCDALKKQDEEAMNRMESEGDVPKKAGAGNGAKRDAAGK